MPSYPNILAPGYPDSPNPPKAPLNPKLPFAARCAGREDLVHRSRGTGGHGEVLQQWAIVTFLTRGWNEAFMENWGVIWNVENNWI